MNGTEDPSEPKISPEKRSLMFPVSIVAGVLLTAAIWWIASPHGAQPPVLAFESAGLDCRFEYASTMTAGPNFVRAHSGSIMTIERHSLVDAKKDWVAGLPDVLFPQVMIQLEENYTDLEETGRTHPKVGGRAAVEIVLRGHRAAGSGMATLITIDIVANDDWVYVLRAYSLEKLDTAERPLFRHVRETLRFIPEAPPGGGHDRPPGPGGAAGESAAPTQGTAPGAGGGGGESPHRVKAAAPHGTSGGELAATAGETRQTENHALTDKTGQPERWSRR